MRAEVEKMTDQEFIHWIIGKAIRLGWEPLLIKNEVLDWEVNEQATRVIFKYKNGDKSVPIVEWSVFGVIYNHEFAKAFWGDSWAHFTEGWSEDTISGNFINYLGHLANMVVHPEPLTYLRHNS